MATREVVATRREQVAALKRKGRGAEQIARILEVPIHIVYHDALMIGDRFGKPPAQFTDELRSKALELFADGCSRTEVAATLGISTRVLAWRLPDHKWTHEQATEHAIACSRACRGRRKE